MIRFLFLFIVFVTTFLNGNNTDNAIFSNTKVSLGGTLVGRK